MNNAYILYNIYNKRAKALFWDAFALFLFFYSRTQVRQAFRRICNPALKNVLTYLGSADLQSAAKENAFSLLGDYKSPGFNRSNLFYGGFQIRRDA